MRAKSVPQHSALVSRARPAHGSRYSLSRRKYRPTGILVAAYIARMTIRRGEIIGRPVGGQPRGDAEHFIQCPACGGWIDSRDLAQVLEHERPLPHPAEDQTN
jgi:hypothetical protein